MREALLSLGIGALFGGGLALSSMTNPARVLGFLDLAGKWDPTLAFVMGGALLVTIPAFPAILRRSRPWLGAHFSLPNRKHIDRRLVGGAVLFGLGWGIAGLCPGPAIAALGLAPQKVWLFVGSMIAGIFLAQRIPDPRALSPHRDEKHSPR
jgi:uncharacterized membrane protein YedE/YeeE